MLTWHVNPVTAKMLKQWSPDQQQPPPGQTASNYRHRVLQSVLARLPVILIHSKD